MVARIALEAGEEAQPSLLRALPEEERVRIGRFRQAADRKRASVAAILPRLAINRLHHVPVDQITLPRTSAGKPFYPDDPGFHFNLSHSGEYVAFAIGSQPVGVDCEQIRSNRDQDAIARRFFAPEEQRWLEGFDAAERLRRFFELWSRKESLLKASGTGLSGSLASFDARPSPPGAFPITAQGRRWFVRSYETLECYSIALCAAQADLPDHPLLIDARRDPLDAATTAVEALLEAQPTGAPAIGGP